MYHKPNPQACDQLFDSLQPATQRNLEGDIYSVSQNKIKKISIHHFDCKKRSKWYKMKQALKVATLKKISFLERLDVHDLKKKENEHKNVCVNRYS